MKSKETKTFLTLIAIVIVVIIIIIYATSNQTPEAKTAKCIGENSILIVSKTCGHCANQKAMFGDNLKYLNMLSIDEDPSLLEKYDLPGVPGWIINRESYVGVQSIERLKELTSCE